MIELIIISISVILAVLIRTLIKHKKEVYVARCSECGKCLRFDEIYVEDHGIGAYEFHGYRGNDVQLIALSHCCEADVIEEDGVVNPYDLPEEYEI